MTTSYDVSIIVSVLHPVRAYLREVVLSAKRLAEKSALSVELLIGNDGSPEEDRPVFEECAALAPGLVRVFHFDRNRGVGRTRSMLVRRSAGRYVMPFDADDVLLPFDLDKEIAFLDANRGYSASYAEKYLFNENGLTGDIHGNDFSDFLAYFQLKVNINAMLIRREALLACNAFLTIPESRINEDVYLMMRLFRYGNLFFSPEPRSLYRQHTGSLSKTSGSHQADYRYMARRMVEKDTDLLRVCIASDFPRVSPERERLLAAVAGGVLFLYQQEQNFVRRYLARSVERFPDDYGAWEMFFFMERNFMTPDRFFSGMRAAFGRFRDCPGKIAALGSMFSVFTKRKIPIPADIFAVYREAVAKKYAVPEEIRRLVPVAEPRKPAYSFRMPVLKF